MTVIDNYRRRQGMGWPPRRRSAREVAKALRVEKAARLTKEQTGCTAGSACRMIGRLDDLVGQARSSGYSVAYLTDADLASDWYKTLDMVMPHGGDPQPGSAYEAIVEALLDPARDEHSLVHCQTTDGPQVYCTVQIVIIRP